MLLCVYLHRAAFFFVIIALVDSPSQTTYDPSTV